MQDFYQILEVHPSASVEVIDKAYRTLVLKYHPDRFHLSDKSRLEERLRLLNDAYETLSNPKLRANYDERYAQYQAQQQQTQQSRLLTARFKNMGYWFLLTVFLLFTGKAILGLFKMMPLGVRVVILLLIAFGIRTVFLKWKARKGA